MSGDECEQWEVGDIARDPEGFMWRFGGKLWHPIGSSFGVPASALWFGVENLERMYVLTQDQKEALEANAFRLGRLDATRDGYDKIIAEGVVIDE